VLIFALKTILLLVLTRALTRFYNRFINLNQHQ
jgi:hypothetical protein